MFWVVYKTDGAAMGQARGTQTTQVVDGPFNSEDDAREVLRNFRGSAFGWYTITEAELEPEDTREEYEFIDAASEFEDVPGW